MMVPKKIVRNRRPNELLVPRPFSHANQFSYPFLPQSAHRKMKALSESKAAANAVDRPEELERFGITDAHIRRIFNKKALRFLTPIEKHEIVKSFFHGKIGKIMKGAHFWGRVMEPAELSKVQNAENALKKLGIPYGGIHSVYPIGNGGKSYVVFNNAGESLESLMHQSRFGKTVLARSIAIGGVIDAYAKMHAGGLLLQDVGGFHNIVLVDGKIGFIDLGGITRANLNWGKPRALFNQISNELAILKVDFDCFDLRIRDRKQVEIFTAFSQLVDRYPMTSQGKKELLALIRTHVMPYSIDSTESVPTIKE